MPPFKARRKNARLDNRTILNPEPSTIQMNDQLSNTLRRPDAAGDPRSPRAGRRDGQPAGRAVPDHASGGLQALQGARAGRPHRGRPQRAAAAVAPRVRERRRPAGDRDRRRAAAGHDDKEPRMTTSTRIVTGVDFVSVPTTDLEASIEFYGDVLGLERSKLWQRPGQEPLGAEFETGKVTIAFQVEDVEAARAQLESRGVRFTGETIDSGVCLQAIFEDPDGNSLDLHHRYA